MRISVQFFATAEDDAGTGKYDLLLDIVRMLDDSAIEAIWLPERHFVEFGGLYPSPSVLGAAVSTITSNVGIRAGSVILPLHDPLRVAEEWSVVDNLSGGRVELSFGSGWNVNDFVLAPSRYEDRRQVMWEQIETVRELWRGGSVQRANGVGLPQDIKILPAPVQPELPVWITAQSDETFLQAAAAGYPVLTNLNFTTPDTIAARCAKYRDSLPPGTGSDRARVAVMVHAFLAGTVADARHEATKALRKYLAANLAMRAGYAAGKSTETDSRPISEEQRDAIVDRGVDRILDWASLIGDEDLVLRRISAFAEQGIDELACLVDFGVDGAQVLRGLELLCGIAEKVSAG